MYVVESKCCSSTLCRKVDSILWNALRMSTYSIPGIGFERNRAGFLNSGGTVRGTVPARIMSSCDLR